MLEKIVQLGNPVLRKKAQRIDDFNSKELTQLIELMLTTLAQSEGVGLAAPQISESLAVIIIASKPNSRYPKAPEMQPIVMINPSFTPLSDDKEKDWEGCLSIPSIRALVPRYKKIQVQFQKINEKTTQVELQGFVARVFQHEYDHLDGLVYLDRVENNQDIISESEFFKLLEPSA